MTPALITTPDLSLSVNFFDNIRIPALPNGEAARLG